MKEKVNSELQYAIMLLAMFAVWTMLIQCIDVQAAGPNGSKVGFATFN